MLCCETSNCLNFVDKEGDIFCESCKIRIEKLSDKKQKCENCGYEKFDSDKKCVYCGIVKIEKQDNVNHPSHYNRGKVECIDALESASSSPEGFQDHCRLTAIKYLYRAGAKNDALEDAKKAIWYINRYIKSLEDKNKNSKS